LIAGLGAATVVVEARERSGALITADLALEEGRDVLAVPGEITSSLSSGTNALLKLGAGPCTSAEDVLELFGLTREERVAPVVGESAAAVLAALPGAADDLVHATGLDAPGVAIALAELELAGLASEGDGFYRAAGPVVASVGLRS
jgi:DNA processing protein